MLDAGGHLVCAALRRRPFPHGRDALARPAAPQRVRHAARRHRALGRAEAAPDARGGGRAGPALLRPRGRAGTARHPQPCRHLRRPAARRRCAARGEAARRALSRPAARRLPAGRLSTARPAPSRTSRARSTGASRWSAASRISSARWRTAPPRCARCARSPPSAACASTCIATRPTIRCRATSRRWPPRRSASGCRAASPARTSPPCIPWTTTTSRSSCR